MSRSRSIAPLLAGLIPFLGATSLPPRFVVEPDHRPYGHRKKRRGGGRRGYRDRYGMWRSNAEDQIRDAQRALIAAGARPGRTKRKGHRKRKFWGQP